MPQGVWFGDAKKCLGGREGPASQTGGAALGRSSSTHCPYSASPYSVRTAPPPSRRVFSIDNLLRNVESCETTSMVPT